MKHSLWLGVLLAATPAFALKVTNLDRVPHNVVLNSAGSSTTAVIEPNMTEHFTGATQGFISLADTSAEVPKGKKSGKAKTQQKSANRDSVVHADGLLSGIIGNKRNAMIPVDPADHFVIWPGGDLRLQGRIKQRGRW